jgi:hypothetical protein
MLGGPQNRSRRLGEKKNLDPTGTSKIKIKMYKAMCFEFYGAGFI